MVSTFLVCFLRNLRRHHAASLKYRYPPTCDDNLQGYGKGEFCLRLLLPSPVNCKKLKLPNY